MNRELNIRGKQNKVRQHKWVNNNNKNASDYKKTDRKNIKILGI